MKRRQFIQSTSAVSLPIILGGMEVSAMTQSALFQFASDKEDHVLVIIQLNGGNDGLNMVIPIDQYSGLSAVRPGIMIQESKVLKLIDKTGIHPSMGEMQQLYKEGELAVVQSVGYPNQNRSHFRSTDIWTTGSKADQYLRTGWMGRYFDEEYDGYPEAYPNTQYPDPFAITIGSTVSETCQGEVANYSFTLNNEASVSVIEETVAAPISSSCYSQKLTQIHEAVKKSNDYAKVVLKAFDKGSNIATYPTNPNRLGDQLKIVANLISGGLKTRIYVVNMGGFDTHANQVQIGSTEIGAHSTLMSYISTAVAAFTKDLKALGVHERVMGMTFSEFGRQIRANNSFGTDHGTAAPLFVFGSCVQNGVFGHNPVITSAVAAQEGVPMQHDFRSVYASLLVDWMGASESAVKNVLFEDFQRIPFVKGCTVVSGTTDEGIASLSISPNPTSDYAEVSLDHPGGYLQISVMDTLGSLLHIQSNRSMSRGTVKVSLDLQEYTAGTYYVRVASQSQVQTIRLVKV